MGGPQQLGQGWWQGGSEDWSETGIHSEDRLMDQLQSHRGQQGSRPVPWEGSRFHWVRQGRLWKEVVRVQGGGGGARSSGQTLLDFRCLLPIQVQSGQLDIQVWGSRERLKMERHAFSEVLFKVMT